MPRKYDLKTKEEVVDLICNKKHSTSKTAKEYDIPLKTVEKWITAHNKGEPFFSNNNEHRFYSKSVKRKVIKLIKVKGRSTSKTALEQGIPLKTVEKWITAYNKDNSVFDE